jgi:hypothetical protein
VDRTARVARETAAGLTPAMDEMERKEAREARGEPRWQPQEVPKRVAPIARSGRAVERIRGHRNW